MTKFYILFLFLFLPFFGAAQPELTENIVPPFGSQYEGTYIQNPTFDQGPGGVNQVWDFSDLEGGIDLNFKILDPATTPESDKFPGATFVWNFVEFDFYFYYEVTEDSLSQMGNAVADNDGTSFLVINSDYENAFQFPVTFGSSYSYSTVYQNFLFGNPVYAGERTAMLTADGYGTLITPYGTFENTLRIKIVNNEFGINSTQYSWLSEDNFVPLLVYEFSDDTYETPSLYFTNLNSTVSTKDSPVDQEVSIVYDALMHTIIINKNGQQLENIALYDMNGGLIENFDSDHQNSAIETRSLTISNPLRPGLYILSFLQDGIVKSKTFTAFR